MADPVFTALAAALRQTSPAPAVVFEDPSQAVAIGAMPCFILVQQTNADHIWRTFDYNGTQPTYTITAFLLIGSNQTPLPILHAASVPSLWPRQVNAVLARDITLGGTVMCVGNGTEFFRYRVGPIRWGESLYWGIRFNIPIQEQAIDG
jgi:hypothetical protein